MDYIALFLAGACLPYLISGVRARIDAWKAEAARARFARELDSFRGPRREPVPQYTRRLALAAELLHLDGPPPPQVESTRSDRSPPTLVLVRPASTAT